VYSCGLLLYIFCLKAIGCEIKWTKDIKLNNLGCGLKYTCALCPRGQIMTKIKPGSYFPLDNGFVKVKDCLVTKCDWLICVQCENNVKLHG
jgi:hypothetical protein